MLLKKYKFVVINILVIIFLLIIVKNTKYKQPRMVNMEEVAESIFFDYVYTYRVTSWKEGSVLAKVVISKKNMPLNSFSNVKNRLIEKKWVLKQEYKGLYTFCYGVENRLDILYPEKEQKIIDLPNNDRFIIHDFDNWVVNFYYREKGVDECY